MHVSCVAGCVAAYIPTEFSVPETSMAPIFSDITNVNNDSAFLIF